jgi:hypothetical protein
MLGTAAYGLYNELTRPRLRSTWPLETVSAIPMPASRGGGRRVDEEADEG